MTAARRLDNIIAPAVVLVAALLLWELLVYWSKPPVFLLPAPHQIWAAFTGNLANLFSYGWNTFLEALGGFAVGCGLGLLAAMVVARFPLIADVLVPAAVASNSIPIVAMAPIALVWFGIGPESKIAIVAVMCFFPTLVSAVRGLTATSPDALALMRSYAATHLQIFTKLRLPNATPYLFTGLKIAATASVIGAIIGELPTGSKHGIGVQIINGAQTNTFNPGFLWATIVMASILGLLFYGAVALAERLIVRWK